MRGNVIDRFLRSVWASEAREDVSSVAVRFVLSPRIYGMLEEPERPTMEVGTKISTPKKLREGGTIFD